MDMRITEPIAGEIKPLQTEKDLRTRTAFAGWEFFKAIACICYIYPITQE